MFGENFRRKYALSEQGVKNTKKGVLWTVIVNLTVMGGIGILYYMMTEFMDVLVKGSGFSSPAKYIIAVIAFLVLSFITHMQQYRATYGLVYGEVRTMRIGLAERLRKLPLAFFGKRDLADLTETIMGDVNRMEHVWSHVLGYLYGSFISIGIIAVMLFIYDWRLAIAVLWGVPVAFILLFRSKRMSERNAEKTKRASLDVSDEIQETLENIREIRATNQEEIYLKRLDKKIDRQETVMKHGEFATGVFVNAASVIMRLGVATTILTGAELILHGGIDFMVLFMFLLVITRVYAPFDQSLALIAEMFLSQVSANRLMEIYETPAATGSEVFSPNGNDIVFNNVNFAYDNKEVLKNVSFSAKEGEVTALVGSSGSGKSTYARLAARLWDIESGTITVGGIDISKIDPEVLLGKFSMVFQDVVLFDDTVMENIRLGKHGATDDEVINAAKAANCEEFIKRLPDGYNTQIGENGAKLSGSERQRISIARALLKDAPIINLEMMYAVTNDMPINKCKNCNKYFVAGNAAAIFCDRLYTKDKTCKQFGGKKSFVDKLKKDEALLLVLIRLFNANKNYLKFDMSKNEYMQFSIFAMELSIPGVYCRSISDTGNDKQINIEIELENTDRAFIAHTVSLLSLIVYKKYNQYQQYMFHFSNPRMQGGWIRYKNQELLDVYNKDENFATAFEKVMARSDFVYFEPSSEKVDLNDVKYFCFPNYSSEKFKINRIADASLPDRKRLKACLYIGDETDKKEIMQIISEAIAWLKTVKNPPSPTLPHKYGDIEADSLYINVYRRNERKSRELYPNNENFVCFVDYNYNGQTTLKNGGLPPNIWNSFYHEKVDKIQIAWRESKYIIRRVNKIGLNEPCPCGSGLKFKKCCRGKGTYDE